MKKRFVFSHRTETAGEAVLERFFGILPGFMSWGLLIGFTVLSFTKPLYGAVAVIAFDLYWFFRILYMTLFLVLAYAVLAVEKGVNWIERCHALEKGESALPSVREKISDAARRLRPADWFTLKNQERELNNLLESGAEVPAFDSIYHVVIMAAAREPREVLEPGLKALALSQFPAARILPILAVEERAGAEHTQMAQALREKYREKFYDFLVTVHPDGVPGEARVKGANVTFAAREAARQLEKRGIPFENVIVSCFDADTVAGPEYFAALTYHFMRNPDRLRASFQPIPVYHNNIWEAPGFARVLETGSSFFQMIEATNPEKLVTFSSHSMSFKALVEIDYWPVDMISDDSAIFWKALIHYGGDYRVIPMYVTLSMDVVMAGSFWQTLTNVYRQKLRWAWGVENLPIVMRGFAADKRIPLINKWRYIVKLLEMHVSWASMGFIVTFVGWLPVLFAGREYSTTVFYYNAGRIAGLIFNLAFMTLLVTIILSLLLLPKKRTRNPWLKRLVYALEWLLVPLVFTFLSSMPALHAQTRLARGTAMEFWVTEKKRKPGGS